jgi:hypothetical protein
MCGCGESGIATVPDTGTTVGHRLSRPNRPDRALVAGMTPVDRRRGDR